MEQTFQDALWALGIIAVCLVCYCAWGWLDMKLTAWRNSSKEEKSDE